MAVVDTVRKLAAPIVEKSGLTLWDIEFKKEGSEYFLRIYIDKADGVSIDDCERVSRALDPVLDEADPIAQSYYLEVCSAGLVRELKTDAHIQAFLGTEAEVHTYKAAEGLPKVFRATLLDCSQERLTVEYRGQRLELVRENISQIKVDLV